MAGIDTKTLGAANAYSEELVAGLESGVESTAVNGQKITFNFKNGTSATMTFPTPENGKDGVTPHIGDNGNWFIGDTDTGIKAGAVEKNAVSYVQGKKLVITQGATVSGKTLKL